MGRQPILTFVWLIQQPVRCHDAWSHNQATRMMSIGKRKENPKWREVTKGRVDVVSGAEERQGRSLRKRPKRSGDHPRQAGTFLSLPILVFSVIPSVACFTIDFSFSPPVCLIIGLSRRLACLDLLFFCLLYFAICHEA